MDIGLNENLAVMPQFSYYFEDLFTVYSFDLNFTYDVAIIAGDVPLYAIGGLDLRTFSTAGASERNLGINLGGGILMGHIYAEVFYRSMFCDGCSSDLGFNLGYYF